jgi:hypothetical protein
MIQEQQIDRVNKIVELFNNLKDWDKVINEEIYIDESPEAEPLIEAIEIVYKTKIKDSKHLQKLTGIKEHNIEWLEWVIVEHNCSKYERALEKALTEGAKYKDLLQINPEDYGFLKTKKDISILRAIGYEFLVTDHVLMLTPDLRSIANEVEAPYSVLMDCYNFFNKR